MVTTKTSEIKIINLNSNPGILPFQLCDVKVKQTEHNFTHFFDVKPLEDEISNIHKQFHKIYLSGIYKETYSTGIRSIRKTIAFQLEQVLDKFNSLHHFSGSRSKRGIF